LAMKSGKAKAIWLFIGDHYLANKDKKKALDAYQEGLALFENDSEFLEKIQTIK
jgi:hypothetical protein